MLCLDCSGVTLKVVQYCEYISSSLEDVTLIDY